MNEVIEEIFRSRTVADAHGNVHQPNGWLSRDAGGVLYELVRAARPERTLETGLGHGISALFIGQALHDNGRGRHIAIDPNQATAFHSIGLANLERARLRHLVEWREQPSEAALPELWRAGERFEFAFIDGSHLFDVALIDFYYIDKMLTVGSYMVFDDVWMPAVRKVISFVLRNRRYEFVRVKPTNLKAPLWKRFARVGVRFLHQPFERDWRLRLVPENVVVLRKTADEDRPWDYHRPF